MAYNLGCLPSVSEVHQDCLAEGKTWACHSAPSAVCAGYAEMFPDRNNLPLLLVDGVHYTEAVDIIGVPPMQGPSADFMAKLALSKLGTK